MKEDKNAEEIKALKELILDLYRKIEEVQPRKPPYRGGIISRHKVERVWEALPTNPGFAMTLQEIADMEAVQLSPAVTQRALYILLTEGRATRKTRQGKVGKVAWEYYKLNIPSAEPITGDQKRFDLDALRTAIPQSEADAISIRDLANAINASPVTIRQKIKLLEAAGEVSSIAGFNENRQPVTKYYHSKRNRS